MSAMDMTARGLAAQTAARLRRARLLDRLAQSIARAGGVLPALSAAPPTLPANTNGDGSVISGGTLWSANSGGAPAAGTFQYLRGSWTIYNSGFPYDQYAANRTITSSPAAGALRSSGFSLIRFWSDAPILQIRNFGNGVAGGYRLRVNGQYAATGLLGTRTGGDDCHQTVQWGDGTAANREMRLYEIEAESNLAFGGVRTSATARVWPGALPPSALRVIVHGDSFVGGAFAPTGLQPQLGQQIALRLGQPNTIVSGIGGTGYIASNGGSNTTFLQRVQPDVIAYAPDVVIELGGTNDSANTAAAIQAAVTTWLSAVVSALPNVLIFMTGPMTGRVATSATTACRDAKAAAAALFPKNVIFIDNIAENWVSGTGYVNAPQNDGNADWITGAGTGADTVHPSTLGIAYLGQRVVEGVAARIPAG